MVLDVKKMKRKYFELYKLNWEENKYEDSLRLQKCFDYKE